MSPRLFLRQRPRRLRTTPAVRSLVQETRLHPSDLVLPIFVTSGQGIETPIPSLLGHSRLSPDRVLELCRRAKDLGLLAVALFPHIDNSLKDPLAKEAMNPQGLIPETVRLLKRNLPELLVITDVALDPYSSDGHDGVVQNGKVLNDETLRVLAGQALAQAEAGADFVAPSDMMDGRVAYIREALDQKNLIDTGIISYAAKYASSFYGPFRDALDSAPKMGDKKTYQMDPANAREAVKETQMDLGEGADMVLVKPALSYLDIIHRVRQVSLVPVCAYNVSGEYAMIKASTMNDKDKQKDMTLEVLTSIKRAGADVIFTYHAMEAAPWL